MPRPASPLNRAAVTSLLVQPSAALLTAPLVETRTRTRTGWNGQVGLPRDFLAARTDRISRSCRRASSIVSAAAAAAAAARGSPNCCPPPPQACHTAPPCMAPRTSTRVHAVGGSASGEVSDRQTAMHVCVCFVGDDRAYRRQTPRSGYAGGQSWLFETHQDKGVPAHLQSHNIL